MRGRNGIKPMYSKFQCNDGQFLVYNDQYDNHQIMHLLSIALAAAFYVLASKAVSTESVDYADYEDVSNVPPPGRKDDEDVSVAVHV